MKLATLLELLYSASDRSKTVQATIRRRHRQARELELLRVRGFYRDPPPIPSEEGSWGEPTEVVETTTRIWAAHPHLLRWESTFSGNGFGVVASVGVKDGDRFWQRFDNGDLQSNEQRESGGTMNTAEERLLDPSSLLGAHRFDVGSSTTLIGRRGVEVTARPRLGANSYALGSPGDGLALVVDEERGVLLRLAVVLGTEELSFSEVTEIVFDKSIPPETFEPLS